MSIFDNKSGQHIAEGSSGIQVTGDFTIGNTSTEVIAICELVVKSQMASLKEDAFRIVDQRAKEFGQQIAVKLSEDLDEKVAAKLADPDIQYSINQAVTQVARKGFDEKSELLKELIVSKIESDQEEDSILIDQALDVTPRLTTNEIKFLAWIHYLRSISKIANGINVTNLAEEKKTHFALTGFTLSDNYKLHNSMYSNYDFDYVKFLGDRLNLKHIKKDYLELKGVIYFDKSYQVSYQVLLAQRTGHDFFGSENSFFEAFPAIKLTLDSFGISSLIEFNSFVINPIGVMIAENYLKARGFLM
ncbi:LPO_1073/Vpar_1526 family protein [Leclercia adecarboxylata]|uniref:LPO_1073/Vpar_1526 family protein n=1 Tax=Leclercia adecarboxylata TaxID=83655 RepID=UPI00370CABF0